jgi:hypothetical protein
MTSLLPSGGPKNNIAGLLSIIKRTRELPPGTTVPRLLHDLQKEVKAAPGGVAKWAKENPVEAAVLAVSPVPIAGDITGLAYDAQDFIRNPESRTWPNYGLAAAGLLPFVPSGVRAVADTVRGTGRLPMDEASRMARAREMGFDVDTPLYHGTDANIEEFKPGRNHVPHDEGAVYASPNPDLASNFAQMSERPGVVYPVTARTSGPDRGRATGKGQGTSDEGRSEWTIRPA